MVIKSVSSGNSQVTEIEMDEVEQSEQQKQLPKMTEAERKEFDSFRTKVTEAANAGTLDAAALAKLAPESFKNAVQAHGDTMESAINRLATEKKNQPQGDKGMGKPPELSTEDKTFIDKIINEAKAGTLNSSALAQQAPASFKKAAEARGETVESAIANMAKGKGAPPKGFETGSSYEEANETGISLKSLEEGTVPTNFTITDTSTTSSLTELNKIESTLKDKSKTDEEE
jgi:hypothetical protein